MGQKILVLIALVFSLNAHADQRFVGSAKFSQMIKDYQNICAVECEKPYREMVLYSPEQTAVFLSPGTFKRLQKIAVRQAYIWADTILEGDYQTSGETVLESVVGIFRSGNLVAYKIQYTEKAWDTSSCGYDYEDSSTLQQCPQGIISETSFVSIDFKTFIRNHDDIATFSR